MGNFRHILHATTGVSVDQFFIWTVPCYLCAVLAIIYGFTGIGIRKLDNKSYVKIRKICLINCEKDIFKYVKTLPRYFCSDDI